MRYLRGNIIWGLILYTCTIIPQSDTASSDLDEVIEKISPAETEAISGYQYVEELSKNPVDLNKADIWELQSIPGVSYNIARSIIVYREKSGRFFSRSEIYLVKDIPAETAASIINFITAAPPAWIEPLKKDNKQIHPSPFLVLRSRLMKSSSYDAESNKYPGDPLKIYNRIDVQYQNFSAGILTEKDPGEQYINDFSSFYLSAENLAIIKSIIIGDYSLRVGQGLIASTPYSIMKSSQAILPLSRNRKTVLPYSSVNENSFFRGAAAAINLINGEAIVFYSDRKIDAVTDTAGFILSIADNGYHRTLLEQSRRGNTNEQSYGAGISYGVKDLLRVQLLHFVTSFNRALLLPEHTSTAYRFSSLSYDLSLKEASLYGETAFDGRKASTLNHFYFPVDKNIILLNSFRLYPGSISIHGNPFAERDGIIKNETGFYTGVKYKSPAGIFNIYFDLFTLKTQGFSLHGKELFAGYGIKTGQAEIELSCRNKLKEKLDSGYRTIKESTENYSLDFIYTLNKNLRLRTRLQYKHFSASAENSLSEGWLFYCDTQYRASVLSLYARIIFFDTGNFDSAVYEYENNVPGVFQNLALYNSGFRWYILAKYKLFNLLNLSFKYSETYKNTSVIDPQPNINQLALQADFQF